VSRQFRDSQKYFEHSARIFLLCAERRRVRLYEYLKDMWTAALLLDGPVLERMTIKIRQPSRWSESP
jgi:hypothetical protein